MWWISRLHVSLFMIVFDWSIPLKYGLTATLPIIAHFQKLQFNWMRSECNPKNSTIRCVQTFGLLPVLISSISIFRLRCCPCPILWGQQHQAMLNTGLPCISVLWVNASWARPHLLTSDFSLSDHIFVGFPCFLVPGIKKFVIDFDAGRGPLYMAIPSELPTVKESEGLT